VELAEPVVCVVPVATIWNVDAGTQNLLGLVYPDHGVGGPRLSATGLPVPLCKMPNVLPLPL
jgi:hypothetical protein